MRMKYMLLLLMVPLLLPSCEKDEGGFTQIKGIENLIYQAIKIYRTDNSMSDPFVLQFIIVKEAQIYSYKMANDVEPLGTQGLGEHWNAIHEKIGGTNDRGLVLRTTSTNEDDILTEILKLPDAEEILLSDVTQCGVGVETDTAGYNYVTVMMLKVAS
ncbi:MAG TPA: hypothetical protein ENO20_00280 [Bacteroides sp.]|nr:hypothetical protein [Bacteroides sp.]